MSPNTTRYHVFGLHLDSLFGGIVFQALKILGFLFVFLSPDGEEDVYILFIIENFILCV